MTEHGSGISISVAQIGTAGAIYVAGALAILQAARAHPAPPT